ncbi:hypothetical protein MMC31_000837 [Peltigera leucophlebia]|nr:hypothetical protein [Peltigera leucophlebia]
MAGAGENRKCGGKGGGSSPPPLKRTAIRSTGGQHAVSTTPLVPPSGRMRRQGFPAASVSSSDVRGPVRGPRTPSPTRLPKQSSVKTPKKPKRPKPAELVTAIKDHVGGRYLYNATDKQKYTRICRYYNARLSFLVYGLNENELAALFTTNMPSFWGQLDEYAQQRMRKSFDDAYDAAEYFLIANISKLAQCWLDSAASREYTKAVMLHLLQILTFVAKDKKSAANSMPPRPKTVADMENYTVSDKIGTIKGIILKEEYMVMIWGYALAACESETFAGTALHHWFAGYVARHRSLYNALFPITGALVVKFARLIVLNPDEDCQNEALRKVLREVDHPLPIESTLEQSMPPF